MNTAEQHAYSPVPDVRVGLYKHYKGGIVEVLGIAHHSETLEDLVVYKCSYECRTFRKGSLWVRPLKMFVEKVIFDGEYVPRFERITNTVGVQANYD